MFWTVHIKLVVFFYLMFFCLPAFAINALVYYESSNNPPSSCMVLYFEGDKRLPNLCSGDIIGKDKLLTAGHCAVKAGETAVVRCPNLDQREWLVKGQLIHPLYPGIEKSSPFDHALLQVESDFLNFKPAPLPQNDEEMYSLLEGECAIFGYGLDFFGNSGTLLSAPILAGSNSSLSFEMFVTIGGPSYVEEGDSGGGLFCRDSNPDSKWIRIATLSQISDLDGKRIMIAAPLSRPIINWIERSLETELPPVASFRGTPPIEEVPIEEMETEEECTLRLLQTAASDSTGQLEQFLEAEILHQCGLTVSQESLNPLLEKHRNQTAPLGNDVSFHGIEESRKFAKQSLGNYFDLFCHQENYVDTPCGECESDLERCLSEAQEYTSSDKQEEYCTEDFRDCIDDVEYDLDDMVYEFAEFYDGCTKINLISFVTKKAAYENPGVRILNCMTAFAGSMGRSYRSLSMTMITVVNNSKERLNYYSLDSEQCVQIIRTAASYSSYLTDNLSKITSEQCQPVLGFPNSNNEAMDYNECASRLEGEGKSEREVAVECVLSNLDLSALENFKLWISSFL